MCADVKWVLKDFADRFVLALNSAGTAVWLGCFEHKTPPSSVSVSDQPSCGCVHGTRMELSHLELLIAMKACSQD